MSADTEHEPIDLSGVRTGRLQPGERVTLSDPKGRRHSVLLAAGAVFHTTKGGIAHDDLIGGPEGVVVTSTGGVDYLALRPLLENFTVTMPRGAAVVYPKDAAQILMGADIFPGARVLEAGAGSGALSCACCARSGRPAGCTPTSAATTSPPWRAATSTTFFGREHPAWELRVGDLVETLDPAPVDRVVLDMLAPWECVEAVAGVLEPGGVICCYVATTPQLSQTVETLRVHGGFTEPEVTETIVRPWHVEGLAVRPGHGSTGHTGFLVFARRLAPGVVAPARKRRPAPGAYGENYTGPRSTRG